MPFRSSTVFSALEMACYFCKGRESVAFNFTVTKECKNSRARLGQLETTHGVIQTPVFMPVGTQATVKTTTPHELEELGVEIILSNTYHLYLRPGSDVVAEAGGLHQFMGWNHLSSRIAADFRYLALVPAENCGRRGHVSFPSRWLKHFISPEKSMDIQMELGADIVMAFDE